MSDTALVGEAIRGRFSVFERKVYVNSCSQGALSDVVRDAYEEYLTGWDENGAEWEHWVERSEAARAAFAGLLGAQSDDVAIQTSVSAAVSALLSALDFVGERNRIVISENEFPTIGQIAHAQELRGAEVVQVAPEPEAYAAAIDERTALVCSTLVSYRTGAVHNVAAIYALAREHGALMLVDGYQGIGAIPLAAPKVGDVVVGGTVKYLLASAGLAFMACRPGLVTELLPTQTGWFADENVFDMQIERYRPHRSARTSADASVERTQTRGPYGGAATVAPSSSRPATSRSTSPRTCAAIAGTPTSAINPTPATPA